ncbi:hypothetical protein P343_00440 [Sporolactobacillus laevolacticus DSM 442]|uniref:Uncharacterized protein n=1 Tax=Sporolactobacillus laevolacticus DSM 442 TaxID=1395513 RepID=V6J1G1_9BACL|nr:hypothetical protein P343_00440 [Sporolactobacillus laevolacticus DSM 442]
MLEMELKKDRNLRTRKSRAGNGIRFLLDFFTRGKKVKKFGLSH